MIRKERRRSLRTVSRVPLDLYDPDGRMIIGEGRFVNVSLTGSLLESRQPLQLHQPIRLQIQTPGKSPIEIAAHVVWKKKKTSLFNYGLRFDALIGNYLAMPLAASSPSRHASPPST